MHTFDTLDQLPRRCAAALEAKAATRKVEVDSVIVAGVGDAYLVGALFRAAAVDHAAVPIVFVDSASLPAFAGPGTLVLAVSETGSDPVSVDAVSRAVDAGAELAIVSPGGHLTDMAEAQGFACRVVPHALVAEAPLLGELFFGLWGLLANSPIGSMLLPAGAEADARGAIDLMTRQRRLFGPEADSRSNPARLLADAFTNRGPLIYGTSTVAEAAAAVWADRLRRTGLPAHARSLRVDAAAEGWPVTTAFRTPPAEALILVDSAYGAPAEVSRLGSAFGKAVTCNELSIDGRSTLERLWGAVYLAEWTAFYLSP